MATKSRYGYNNLLLGSSVVISSSSDAASYASANLSNKARYKRWRSSTVNTDHWVKFDLGANASFQLMAVVSAKRTTGGSLNFQANATDVWTSPTVNQVVSPPTVDATEVWAYFLPASQSLRWFRFYFTNVGPVTDYAEVGVAFAGPYFEPAVGIVGPGGGLNFQRADPSNIITSLNGQEFAQKRKKMFVFQGGHRFLGESDTQNFRGMYETVGLTDPLIFALDPSDNTRIMYGRFASVPQEAYEKPANWSIPINVKEYV